MKKNILNSSNMSKSLYLLDAMALLYRAYYAFIRAPMKNSQGFNTSALFGFTNTLLELIEKQQPTHLAVATDRSEPTERHTIFPQYKAQRDAMPEELAASIPEMRLLLEAFRIPLLEAPGYEADDIIGTVAKKTPAEVGVFMVTPDKDFAQLVAPNIHIYKPGRQGTPAEILGVPEILTKWEINNPTQVIDILALWGDASDNIPGIPGIGEKTAKKLIASYQSLENLLKNTSALKGKQKENIEKFAEQGLLSKRLVTINCDVPIETNLDSFLLQEPNEALLTELLQKWEFSSIGKRLFGERFASKIVKKSTSFESQDDLFSQHKSLENTPHTYQHITTTTERDALIATLKKQQRFCFDLETTGLDITNTRILGIALCTEKNTAAYLSFPPQEEAQWLQALQPLFTDPTIEKIGHNLKFDLGVLAWKDIPYTGPFFDTMLAHQLLEPAQKHTMDALAEQYLQYTPITLQSLIGETKDADISAAMEQLSEKNPTSLAEYAAEDADITWQLAELLRPKIKDTQQEKIFFDIEMPLLPVLISMEREGIALQKDTLTDIQQKLTLRIAELEKEIYQQAGTTFNLNSPKQLGQILFDILKLVAKPKKTKTGQYATSEQELLKLAPKHPIIQHILDYREAAKLQSTYVEALPKTIHPQTQRIHTTYHQLVTSTGRLASTHPNLQNIPIRTKLGREIRRAFIPRNPDYLLHSADYSQIELRIMASLSGDTAMQSAFAQNQDIHTATAARLYDIALEDVLPEMRRQAKTVNFGIIYGISAFGLSQRLAIPRAEAQSLIDAYFEKYPAVQQYMEDSIAQTRTNGYAQTLLGRRRTMPNIDSRNAHLRNAAERTAINMPIQGTAADMIKRAMIDVQNFLQKQNTRTRLLLQVHDELIFDLHKEEQDTLPSQITQCMERALPLTSVPIKVDSGTAENWLEAH